MISPGGSVTLHRITATHLLRPLGIFSSGTMDIKGKITLLDFQRGLSSFFGCTISAFGNPDHYFDASSDGVTPASNTFGLRLSDGSFSLYDSFDMYRMTVGQRAVNGCMPVYPAVLYNDTSDFLAKGLTYPYAFGSNDQVPEKGIREVPEAGTVDGAIFAVGEGIILGNVAPTNFVIDPYGSFPGGPAKWFEREYTIYSRNSAGHTITLEKRIVDRSSYRKCHYTQRRLCYCKIQRD